MQQEMYHIGPISVVPVENLTRRELFDGIENCFPEEWEKIKENRAEIVLRLRKWIPAFVDDTVLANDAQCPNIFNATHYDIPLLHGKVRTEVRISNDLGKRLLDGGFVVGPYQVNHPQDLAEKFNGKSGVFIAAEYHWNGNNGKGLKLGSFPSLPNQEAVLFSDQYLHVFERTLNALCQRDELTERHVCSEYLLKHPLSYSNGRIVALIRDPTLEKVKAADQPINEFMEWMQKNAVQVNTMGELTRLAQHSYLMAEVHRQRTESVNVSTTLPATIKGIGNQYLKLAQEAYAELHPPRNNRMNYLVN